MRKTAYTAAPTSLIMMARQDSLYEVKARVVAAIANPKRLEIIDLLADGERTVSELSVLLELAQATTSQHLSLMRKAGVVSARRQGNFVFYRVSDPRISTACRAMSEAVVSILTTEQERLRPALGLPNRHRSATQVGT